MSFENRDAVTRLLESIRGLDGAASLSEVLDALALASAREAARAVSIRGGWPELIEVPVGVRSQIYFFHRELIRTLAGGDAMLLGKMA